MPQDPRERDGPEEGQTRPLFGPGASEGFARRTTETGPAWPTTAGAPTPETRYRPGAGASPSDGEDADCDELSERPAPGRVLFGRFLVERQLGQGGMGTVWLVRHRELDDLRALKLIVPGIAFNQEARARFRREARIMARLKHPNAVTVHDACIARGVAYIEMEYVPGTPLDRLLEPEVPMPLGWVARILEQLCDALQAAHDAGIVHRDLKPSNLMLVDGRPPGREFLKVLDFGIAKILQPGSGEVNEFETQTGRNLYTPRYASPEQIAHVAVDGRTDLYSVGVILYELLTGFRPFSGASVAFGHLSMAPPPFAERAPGLELPEGIERVVMRCLAKRPEDRPESPRALLDAFLDAVPTGEHAPPSSWRIPDRRPPPRRDPADSTVAVQGGGGTTTTDFPGRPSATTEPAPPRADPAMATTALLGAPATPRSRRRALMATAVLSLLAVAAFVAVPRLVRRPPRLALPEGYQAEDPTDLVDGLPRILVRQGGGPRLVRIEGGSFVPGDDAAATPVVLSGFYLQETEVTNAQMEAYFRAKGIAVEDRPPRWREACLWIEKEAGHDAGPFPAVGISHRMAEDVAHWMGGELPTEAQWEYAARSRGQPRRYVWGNAPEPGRTMAHIDNIGDSGYLTTATVRFYPTDRTEQGIYDLTGNVREWCRDAQGGSDSEGAFVIRGGSYLTWKDQCTTTYRTPPVPMSLTTKELAEDGTASDVGFRIVLEWPPGP